MDFLNSKLIYFLSGLLFISVSLNVYLFQYSLSALVKGKQSPPAEGLPLNQQTEIPEYKKSVEEFRTASEVTSNTAPEFNANLNLLAAKAEQLFLAHQFIDAVDHLEQVMVIDKDIAKQINEHWLNSGYLWVERKQLTLLNDFLEAYLTRFPFDEQWLKVKIQWYLSINHPKEALLIYINLADNAVDYQNREVWLNLARQLFDKYAEHLKNQKSWQTIIDVSGLMIGLDNSYSPYYLALAEAYIKINEPETAQNYLDNVDYVAPYQQQIDNLYQMIESLAYQQQGVELVKKNQHFMVSAIINEQHNANLMIDTGASLTVISNRLYEQIIDNVNFKNGREMHINTAGGNQIAFSIIVDEFTLGGETINDFEIVVMELPNFNKADGLLGMNFLQHFRFEIDQQNSLLFLSNPE